ncbi:hypothetical protein SAMN04487891_102394 [Flagellimonas taeanensis]|uniref:Uncharacterized protein n=1 Tax=Flagellimonas taeanensis TaxID=1005926 RepID=A0A1M6SBX9_9FLAO|nr:hypothetical protein [Allomuricauda taeanensis]SFB79838.1 hypothetical protein SAMN04487891_102394 [Allomuricauda taeanensis]SHK42241.1 hypothetical protein SAMN05216293_1073 [Allomuricauda taeanensis]
MKNVAYFIAGAALMLFSCSTDETLYHNGRDVPNSLSGQLPPLPENDSNTYDLIGEIYREALDRYLKTGGIPNLNQLRVEMASLFLGHARLPGKRPATPAHQINKMDIAANDPWHTLEEIIVNSHLTSGAQASLLDFIGTVLVPQYDGHDILYSYITGYESLVMEDADLTEEDKRVILTFSSLVRHNSLFTITKEGDPDDDWDNMVANMIDFIIIAMEDTLEGTAYAMALSLGSTIEH